MQDGFVESFNGRLRDECLNVHQFPTLHHARHLIAAWRDDYDRNRPQFSLDGLTPREYHQWSEEDQTLNIANSKMRIRRRAGEYLATQQRHNTER